MLLSPAVVLMLTPAFAGAAQASDPVGCTQTNRFTNSCLVEAIEPATPARPVTEISGGKEPASTDPSNAKKPSGSKGPGSACVWGDSC